MKPFALVLAALTATAFVAQVWAAPAAASDVVVDAAMAYPESLSSTPDGTLYIGSINRGEVYRALKGEKRATTWISKQAGNFGIVLGVLADARSNRLYICDNHGDSAYLKTFSLKTAGMIKNYEFPGGGLCNDIALKGQGIHQDAYVTDTKNGRVLKLAAGSDVLTVWYVNDKSDPSLDGLVWKGNTLYANTYNGNHVIAVPLKADGSAGPGTILSTSMDIYQPDGMRLSQDGKILMVEGRGKDGNGRLDEVTVSGNNATIRVIKDHYMLPTAVTTVGSTAYVLEAKLNYERDPALKGKDPGTFTAYAVPLK